jgi:DNA-binding SARP family transcriptional activator
VIDGELTETALEPIADPAALLELAWRLEPLGRYAERAAVLDRLAALLGAAPVPDAPPDRDWRCELWAERSIDAGRERRLDEARALVADVLREAGPAHQIAIGRALLAEGQALAWIGTDDTNRRARRAFAGAVERFAALGHRDWQGSALLRWGYSACYQHGDLIGAEALIRRAVDTYDPDGDRLHGALGSYADVLIDLGEFERAGEALDRATAVAQRRGLPLKAEVPWAWARITAARGDGPATERLLADAERIAAATDWWPTHIGTSFLLDAAELLDRVGRGEAARDRWQRARDRAGPENEEVMQTTAFLCARSGDPHLALELLQKLARGDWLEKRTIWRHTLMTAWATFRAGRGDAGVVAARALEQAAAAGGVRVATAGEPDLAAALAPLAQAAGSSVARALVLDGRGFLVRVFGNPSVVGADGSAVELPAGKPGELVRMLALHEHGLALEAVLDTFFAGADPSAARHRMRQVLARLRAAAGEIVVRDGDRLRLADAWVDVRAFRDAAERARDAAGAHAVQLAYGALALRTGPLLPTDPYAAWALEARELTEHEYLKLLDLVAADAADRGSHQEALTALQAALAEDPMDEARRVAMSEHLVALRRHQAAEHVRGGATRGPRPPSRAG